MLADLGVLDALLERGIVSTGFQYRDRRTGPIAELDLGVLAEDTPYPFRVQCEQSKLTPILLERLLELRRRRRSHFGQRVVAASTTDGDVGHGDHRGRRHLHRRLGGRCRRRQLRGAADAIGAEFEGITYPERFLVVSTTEDLAAVAARDRGGQLRLRPRRVAGAAAHPGALADPVPDRPGHADEVETDPARVQERLRGVADLGRDWDLLHASLYRVHQRVADRFRDGPRRC